jgi:hypothetical protein
MKKTRRTEMKKRKVLNVEELYAAINDPANEPVNIVMATGTYVLKADAPGGRGGRLELQRDMSLIGVNGNRSAVKIDTSSLPLSSFNVSFGPGVPTRTGAIRIGRGSNAIEWLTIIGNVHSAADIETDLADTDPAPPTVIQVKHVVSGGSSRGLDVRNIGPAMHDRIIIAEIVDNDFSSGIDADGQHEAIRLVNFVGADRGKIDAVMHKNTFHHSSTGCFVGNNRTSSGVIKVRSNLDHFEQNGVGCVIAGAIVQSGTQKSNTITFDAHGSKFLDNTGPFQNTGPFPAYSGGILALGAELIAPATASDGTVLIVLRGCKVSGNQNKDFEAFGARSTGGGTTGTNNKVTISLKNESAQVLGTDSQPSQPAGTLPADLNKVTVISS